VLSSQRAKVFQISRRFSSISNGSQNGSNVGSVKGSSLNRLKEANFKVYSLTFNFYRLGQLVNKYGSAKTSPSSMKAKQQYYQNLHNPSPASSQYAESLPKSGKNAGFKLVRDKLKNRRPSSGAHSKKNSASGRPHSSLRTF